MNSNGTKSELVELNVVGGGKWYFLDTPNIVILENWTLSGHS